jgi:FG-GAP repeat
MPLVMLIAASSVLAMGGAAPRPAFNHETELAAWDGNLGNHFGWAVALSGNTLVAGAAADSPGGLEWAGAAYVFVHDGTAWVQEQKLTAFDGAAGDFYGLSVAVSGDTLVVGSITAHTPDTRYPGAAYVYTRTGGAWTLQQKLFPSDGLSGDQFGWSAALEGDTLVVGAYTADTIRGVDSGSAYVFTRAGSTWTEQQKLLASDGVGGDHLGGAAALSGDTVVAGAQNALGQNGYQTGAAYVFARAGVAWTQQQKLSPQDGRPDDFFGQAVALAGDTVLVGALAHDPPAGQDAGGAYVFLRSGGTWSLQQKLLASDGAPVALFGRSVALSGPTAVVGADNAATAAGASAGAAYAFTRTGTTWSEQSKILAPDGAPSDYFGFQMAMSGNTLAVTALFGDGPPGAGLGTTYVLRRTGSYYALPPCRVVDTREGGAPLAGNSDRPFRVVGFCRVPLAAGAVAASITVVEPGDRGNLRIYPAGGVAPVASALNFAAGRTRAGNGIFPLGESGFIGVRCDMPAGSAAAAHFVLDVQGYFK